MNDVVSVYERGDSGQAGPDCPLEPRLWGSDLPRGTRPGRGRGEAHTQALTPRPQLSSQPPLCLSGSLQEASGALPRVLRSGLHLARPTPLP